MTPRCWETLNSAFQEKPPFKTKHTDACRHARKTAQEPEEEPELHTKKKHPDLSVIELCGMWLKKDSRARVFTLKGFFFFGGVASRSHVVMINIIPIICQWF